MIFSVRNFFNVFLGKFENLPNEAQANMMETSFNGTQLLPASYASGARKRRKVRIVS